MDKIYRKVQIPSSGLTNNINLNLFLTEKFTLMGVMDSDLTSEANPIYNHNNDDIIVTGYTENRLSEIKTFDLQQPYKIGINGVTNIIYTTDGKYSIIYYTIDGITYITDVINKNITVYSYIARGIDSIVGDTFSLIRSDRYINLYQKPNTKSYINVEREQLSVLDNHYRIKNIKNIGDLITYAGGNYFDVIS